MSFLVILYLYDMLQKTYVKSFFEIPIKTFIIKALLEITFWLKAVTFKGHELVFKLTMK